MPINSPLDIPNCQVWIDASDLNTLWGLSGAGSDSGDYKPTSSGQLVGYIQDKSLNNRHFTNFTGPESSRPQLIRDLQNGRSVLRFNGVNYLTSLFSIPISAQTVFAVASRRLVLNQSEGRIYTQSSQAIPLSSDKGNATSNHFIPMVVEGGGSLCSYVSGALYALNPPSFLSAFDVYTSSLSTNSVSGILVNYVAGLSTVLFPARRSGQFLNVETTRIGGGLSSNSVNLYSATTYTFLTGDIAEVIMYDRYLTREERTSVEWYLANKWNLPLTFYAINSGNWSNEAIWSVSGTPLPRSNVYSNGYNILIDSNIRAAGLFGIHSTPVQNTVSTAGTFTLLSSYSLNISPSGIVAGTNVCLFVGVNDTRNFSITGNVLGGANAGCHGVAVSAVGGTLTVFGNVSGGGNALSYGLALSGNFTLVLNPKLDVVVVGDVFGRNGHGVINLSTDYINITGNLIMGGYAANINGVRNATLGTINITSNVLGGPFSSSGTAHGINNASTGNMSLVGNISASALNQGAISSGYFEAEGSIHASDNFHGYTGSGTNLLSCRFYSGSANRSAVFGNFRVPKEIPNMVSVFDNRYAVTNLLSSSNSFVTPNWSQPFQPISINPGAGFSPLKGYPTTATGLVNTANTGIFAIRRHFTTVANTVYNFSVYCAPDSTATEDTNLELFFLPVSSGEYGGVGAIFDISSSSLGQVLTNSPNVIPTRCCFENITKMGRFGITFTALSSRNAAVEIRLSTSTTTLSQHVAGSTNQKLLIFGSQLTSTGGPYGYVETSNTSPTIAQITYDPGVFLDQSTFTTYYNANNYSVLNLPNPNDVLQGVAYGGFNEFGIVTPLTGNIVLPDSRGVRVGTRVGSLTGTGILYVEDTVRIWDVLENTITTPGSIGERLKAITTTFEVGSALNSMNF